MKIFILIIFKYTAFYTKSLLRNMGWTVVRIWESDVKKNVDECIQLVQETLFEAMMSNYDDLCVFLILDNSGFG